jgi:type I restriction enzyme S subunit
MEMKKYKLGDIASIIVGYPFESERFNTNGKGVRLVRGMNISERFLRFGEEARWWDDLSDKLRPYYLQEDDILIGMDGSKVGKNFAIVKKDDLPLLLVQRVACVRAKKGFDQHFIWQYVSSPRFMEYVNTIKTGSSIPHISGGQIASFPIFASSYDVQKKIGALFSFLDSKISLNQAINRNLEALAKQLYDYWFVQFDFPDENDKPYKSSGGKMVFNEKLKRKIPKGWDNTTLEHFLTIKNGRDHKHLGRGNYPVFGSGGEMRCVNEFLFNGESVLMPRKGSLNNILYLNKAFWTVDTMFYSEMRIPHCAKYVFFSIKDIDFTRWNSGTGVPSMTASTLYSIPMIMPNNEILENFDMAISPLFKRIEQIQSENNSLTKQRDELLPLLMNGQVSVNSDL